MSSAVEGLGSFFNKTSCSEYCTKSSKSAGASSFCPTQGALGGKPWANSGRLFPKTLSRSNQVSGRQPFSQVPSNRDNDSFNCSAGTPAKDNHLPASSRTFPSVFPAIKNLWACTWILKEVPLPTFRMPSVAKPITRAKAVLGQATSEPPTVLSHQNPRLSIVS